MAATTHRFVLRLISPHQPDVVDTVRAHLDDTGEAPIDVNLSEDVVIFSGATSDARLRQRVGQALVRSLGPAGWYDYFRPLRR